MNDKSPNSCVSRKKLKDACTTTDFLDSPANDGQASTRSTYALFLCILSYILMFVSRLCKDIYHSLTTYIRPVTLPHHITELLRLQREIQNERESTYHRTYHRTRSAKFSVKNLFQALKSYIISSEDDITLQCTSKKGYSEINKEPVFVIVESNSLSNPSSHELLIDSKRHDEDSFFRGKFQKPHLKQGVIHFDTPSTSKDHRFYLKQNMISFESKDELQLADINLQSENEIPLDDNDIDRESIVLSYLRNKDAFLRDGITLSTKKKSSLLRSVPKMETILEGEQFSAFPLYNSETNLSPRSMSKQNYMPK